MQALEEQTGMYLHGYVQDVNVRVQHMGSVFTASWHMASCVLLG